MLLPTKASFEVDEITIEVGALSATFTSILSYISSLTFAYIVALPSDRALNT